MSTRKKTNNLCIEIQIQIFECCQGVRFLHKICRFEKDTWIWLWLYLLRTIVRMPKNDTLKIWIQWAPSDGCDGSFWICIILLLLKVEQVGFEFIKRYEFKCFSCTKSLQWKTHYLDFLFLQSNLVIRTDFLNNEWVALWLHYGQRKNNWSLLRRRHQN